MRRNKFVSRVELPGKFTKVLNAEGCDATKVQPQFCRLVQKINHNPEKPEKQNARTTNQKLQTGNQKLQTINYKL